jgi:hypothetical protein
MADGFDMHQRCGDSSLSKFQPGWEEGVATMKSVTTFGIITAAVFCAAPLSVHWSPAKSPSLSVDTADARVGRPLTPMSVAGVNRRAHRRAHYGVAAGAAAVGALAAGAASAQGYGYGYDHGYADNAYVDNGYVDNGYVDNGYAAPVADLAAPAYGYGYGGYGYGAPVYGYAAPAYAAPAPAYTSPTVVIVAPSPAYTAAPPVAAGYYGAGVVSQPIYAYAPGYWGGRGYWGRW